MENLYAIDNMLYTHERLVERELEQDAHYTYLEPELFDLGNDIFIIFDNENTNFEIIKYICKGVYQSLTIERVNVIKEAFKNIVG